MGTFITLTTDFGLSDGYVAAMKAVIYSINPEATVVDVTHSIHAQDIRQAALVLNTAYLYFPSYTVHLIVVDPGVGTNRLGVILKTPKAHFVAPDNGVLSYVLESLSGKRLSDGGRVKVEGDLKAYAINRSEYWHKPVSNTFQGRDVFAPVAARLSLGLMASSLGDNLDTLFALPVPHPIQRERGLVGHVQHIDGFGNLITDVTEKDLPKAAPSISIVYKGEQLKKIARTYGEGNGPVALFGGSGYLEIALTGGNAARFFNSQVADTIDIQWQSEF